MNTYTHKYIRTVQIEHVGGERAPYCNTLQRSATDCNNIITYAFAQFTSNKLAAKEYHNATHCNAL